MGKDHMGDLDLTGRIILQWADRSDTQFKMCMIIDRLNTRVMGLNSTREMNVCPHFLC